MSHTASASGSKRESEPPERRRLRRQLVTVIGAACLVSLALVVAGVVLLGTDETTFPEDPALQNLRGIVRTSDPLTISVLGDSTGNDEDEWVSLWARHLGETHSVTVHRWDGDQGAYNDARKIVYGARGSPVVIWNMSHTGATASYPADKLQAGQPEKPDLVILNFGHNNDKTNVIDQLDQVRRSVSQRWHTEIPTVAVLQNPGVNQHGAMQRETVAVVARWAREDGVPTIDVASAFAGAENQPSLMYDNIHPNSAGSRLWAEVVEKALG